MHVHLLKSKFVTHSIYMQLYTGNEEKRSYVVEEFVIMLKT